MKALVIEDELLAREHMVKLLQGNFPEVPSKTPWPGLRSSRLRT